VHVSAPSPKHRRSSVIIFRYDEFRSEKLIHPNSELAQAHISTHAKKPLEFFRSHVNFDCLIAGGELGGD